MKQTLNLQSNYSAIENGYQLWIPLDCSISIPEDDPVRLLNAVAERMDYREIEAAYSRYGRIEYSPKILTKVIIKKTINIKCWQECGEKETLYTVGRNVNWCNHHGE